MRKEFNVTGSCNPQWHYMVDTPKRFKAVEALIDKGKYFTINRARQFGKTTLLRMVLRKLSDKYLIVPLSFEGWGDEAFVSSKAFATSFCRQMARHLVSQQQDEGMVGIWKDNEASSIEDLSFLVTTFCKASAKPVVMTIDEVDKSSNNQLFLNFLGMLRNMYLERDREGMDFTFHSVILAGVYDIKNLKLKLRPDAERKYNSPWNIAADFNVDMTFHPEEIAQMLGDYENDVLTGMDIKAVSEEIYKYTSGYPFLVCYICKMIDEQLNRKWTSESIVKAVKAIVQGGSTLMDDLSKNLENNAELRNFLYSIVVNGQEYSYSMIDPMVRLANTFSYIKENQRGKAVIHNLIFEEALFVYFSNKAMREQGDKISPFVASYIRNGKLNMEHVVERFRDLMREEYRDSTGPFLEKEGRLLFLTFLKPIINGVGFYYVEPQTRDNRRMDLVVTYERQEFIVELKIWRGEKYEESGRDQLAAYLATRGMDEGYLVTFDFSKTAAARRKHLASMNPPEQDRPLTSVQDDLDDAPHWQEWNGKRIFEVIV